MRFGMSLLVLMAFSGMASATPTTITNLPVYANIIWNDTGIDIAAGESILFEASGVVYGCQPAGPPCERHPDGWSPSTRPQSLEPDLAAYALIGKVGGSGSAFFIGSSFERISADTGRLYLTMNDEPGAFGDNSGSWVVNGQVSTVPEPSSAALFLLGLGCVSEWRRRRAA